MAKHILTGRAAEGAGPSQLAPVVAAFSQYVSRRSWIRRCVVHVATDALAGALGPPRGADGVDVMVELWASTDAGDLADAPLAQASAYRVEEMVEKGDGVFAPGPVEGIMVLARLTAKPGLSLSQVRAGYDRHPLTALRVHGMERYSRHWTQEVLTKGATPFFGFSILHYATDEDRIERHYNSPEGRQEIREDLDSFLDYDRLLVMEARTHAIR